jgi:hypothetical protein
VLELLPGQAAAGAPEAMTAQRELIRCTERMTVQPDKPEDDIDSELVTTRRSVVGSLDGRVAIEHEELLASDLFYCLAVLNARGTVVRLNKGGLILSAFYTVYFCIFFGWAWFADFKSSAFLSGISVIPAELFLAELGKLLGFPEYPFSIDSRLNTMPAYYIESVIISYLAGWAISALTRS